MLSLYWHTVRHLRPGQIGARLRFLARRNPSLSLSGLPRGREARVFPEAPARRPGSMPGPDRFRFLNTEGVCRRPDDWNAPDRSRLWLYNLHYFDDLAASGAPDRVDWHRDLLARWIRENPPRSGTGWEPYPTSLRIVNWVKWHSEGHPPPPGFDESLALQLRWLRKRVEHHLLGNHLLANAKALVCGGLHFSGAEAEAWTHHGLSLLQRELPRQILDDGGHHERSPMYHAIVLEDILDLLNAGEGAPDRIPATDVNAWRECAGRMLGWLRSVTHADGRIALLNDAAFGIASTPSELEGYAARLGVDARGGARGEASGYVRAERGPALLLADVAPVGPDEQPGHGHADTLTFELSLFGERVIVDTGTSTYEPGLQRAWERSTAAHNTVQIEGLDSSECWATFRVARRARPMGLEILERDDHIEIRGAHDGYARLPGRPIHHRSWTLDGGRLRITDRISGPRQSCTGRFLFHPSVIPLEPGVLGLPGDRRLQWELTGASAELRPALWHPEFGAKEETHCLHCIFEKPEATIEFRWGAM